MKHIVRHLREYAGLWKVVLLLAAVWCTGAVQGCWSNLPPLTSDMPVEEQHKATMELYKLTNNLADEAKKKTDTERGYSPYDYFSDLAKIRKREKELGIGLGMNSGQNTMIWLFQQNIRKSGYTEKDIDIAREKFKSEIDFNHTQDREETLRIIQGWGWKGLWCWISSMYFRCLPLAFILYLIWWVQDESKKPVFKRPVMFLLLLIGYPVVLGYIYFKWARAKKRQIWAEAELRRTREKLFSFISEDEIKLIKRFAQSRLTLRDWRRSLDSRGLVFQHSFAVALVVTLLFVFVPRPSEAKERGKSPADGFVIVQTFGLHLPMMDIDGGDSSTSSHLCHMEIPEIQHDTHNHLFRAVDRVPREERRKKPRERKKKIEHIPIISASQPSFLEFFAVN